MEADMFPDMISRNLTHTDIMTDYSLSVKL
jgi:hypothetical protein